MQALFNFDMCHENPDEVMDRFCTNFNTSKKSLPFFYSLVNGILPMRSEIDGLIERFSSNWRISRMVCVDRNILRIAVYELLFCDDIPAKVSINEAIDIGKKYGTEESGAFINGILDSIRKAIEKGELEIEPPGPIAPEASDACAKAG